MVAGTDWIHTIHTSHKSQGHMLQSVETWFIPVLIIIHGYVILFYLIFPFDCIIRLSWNGGIWEYVQGRKNNKDILKVIQVDVYVLFKISTFLPYLSHHRHLILDQKQLQSERLFWLTTQGPQLLCQGGCGNRIGSHLCELELNHICMDQEQRR